MLCEGDQQLRPLSLEEFTQIFPPGQVGFPEVTEKGIEDRSKGDVLSKGRSFSDRLVHTTSKLNTIRSCGYSSRLVHNPMYRAE